MESHYMGKPLSGYGKAELIAIIEDMGLAYQKAAREHMRQIDILSSARSQVKG